MIISNNIPALNALNSINKNNKKTNNISNKLASGLSINIAADDAAGMAISEKMRAQIRGLRQAERNVQDGISLIQTAEAGLSCILDPPLQRMRELAIQASNGTLTKEDRQKIQNEIEQMKQAIDDIANNTHFNTKKLLEGTFSGDSYIISPATFSEVVGNVDLSLGLTVMSGVNDTLNFKVDGVEKSITLDAGNYTSENLLEEINNKLTSANTSLNAYYKGYNIVFRHSLAGSEGTIQDISGSALSSLFITINQGEVIGHSFYGRPVLNPSVTITSGVNDTLTFKVDETSYTIVIPEGVYQVYYDPCGLNTNSIFFNTLNNLLDLANAPVRAGYVAYYHGLPTDGTSIRFELGANKSENNSLATGDYTFGSFSGNAKTILFNQFRNPEGNFIDSSESVTVNITSLEANVIGSADLSQGLIVKSGINDILNFKVDGVIKSIILNEGSYSASELLNHINSKLIEINANVTASYLNDNLALTHNIAGSTHTIGDFSGNAVQSLLISTSLGDNDVIGDGKSINFQVGANAKQSLALNISDVTVNSLGINNISVETQEKAQKAISLIDDAMQKVSSERSKLGAYQNALEHISNNLTNYEENLTAAESRIRDLDMAKAISQMVKTQILQQASTAMLAQANALPQNVLQILK